MIFRQWYDVLTGEKTQTRRTGEPRYRVGSVQAVIPKYLHPAVWWKAGQPETARNPYDLLRAECPDMNMGGLTIATVASFLTDFGYERARIRITAVRQEPVQDITWEDALAEGIHADGYGLFYCAALPTVDKAYPGEPQLFKSPIECYAALWDSINTKKGYRWQDNPVVNVYTFARAESVLAKAKVAA